jgi:hypothetical protein
MIKSYYDDNHDLENSLSIVIDSSFTASVSKSLIMSQSVSIDQESESKIFSNSSNRDRGRLRKYSASTAYLSFVFNTTDDLDFAFVFASTAILAFAVVFKFDSVVHIVLSQFAAFRQKEIEDLIEKDVFQLVSKDDVSSDVRIFNFRFVNEIKHFDIDKTFEKSRLVVQTFNDQNKNLILTQSFIIQRINQRLIVCLIVVFLKMNLYLRNIIQTYVQSITSLNRDLFVRSFVELIKHFDIDTNSILKVVKSLYDVFEVDNHWFVIYHAHHVNELEMSQSIYDFCLLYTNMKIDTLFNLQTDLKNDHLRTDINIVNIQTNDILILIDSNFAAAKKKAIIDVKIMIKSRDNLESNFSLKFNDTIIKR